PGLPEFPSDRHAQSPCARRGSRLSWVPFVARERRSSAMFIALWRRWRNGNSVLSKGKRLRGGRHPSYRPRLEPLEGRELPALLSSGLLTLVSPPGAVSAPLQTGSQLPGSTAPVRVTVAQNSPATVIDLGPVFAAMPGIQHQDGLQLAILGNTNSRLVAAELSEAALTLTYTRGQYGTATITVNATDAGRVGVQQTVVVTVRPLSPTGAVGVTAIPAPPQMSMPLDNSP